MQNMIENLINGNLKDAKEHAKRKSGVDIFKHLRSEGWSEAKAYAAASYLKTGKGFQAYCDAT